MIMLTLAPRQNLSVTSRKYASTISWNSHAKRIFPPEVFAAFTTVREPVETARDNKRISYENLFRVSYDGFSRSP